MPEVVRVAPSLSTTLVGSHRTAVEGLVVSLRHPMELKEFYDSDQARLLGFAADLPPPGRSSISGEAVVLWHGSGRWLHISASRSPSNIHESEEADGIVDLSHSRVCFRIEGRDARTLLATGSMIDFRAHSFSNGDVALTMLGKFSAVVHAVEAQTFDILVWRSLANSFAGWLTRAGEEFHVAFALPSRRPVLG